jgi:hypothetical protein
VGVRDSGSCEPGFDPVVHSSSWVFVERAPADTSLIRSLLRSLTLVQVSLIAFFVVLGGSALAAISSSGDAASAAPGTTASAPQTNDTVPGSPAADAREGGTAQEHAAAEAVDLVRTKDAAPKDRPAPKDADSVVQGSQTHGRDTLHRSARPKKRHSSGKNDGKRSDADFGGPPPSAPAHGFRCKQAGNAPGSAAFHACINSPKSAKPTRGRGR